MCLPLVLSCLCGALIASVGPGAVCADTGFDGQSGRAPLGKSLLQTPHAEPMPRDASIEDPTKGAEVAS